MLLLAAAITIHTDFEGGNLGRVEHVSPTHIRCAVAGQKDQDGRNRQANWYYFRIDGARGQEVTVDLVDLPGEYNYQPTRGAVTKDTLPVYSEDDRRWTHFEKADFDAAEPRLRLRFTPQSDRFWIAHVPPYTLRHLDELRREAKRHKHFKETIIGKSVEGRDLPLWTITNGNAEAPGKRSIWLMFRQHSWETGSSWVGEGAVRFLLSNEAASLRDKAVFKIFPICDPDGMVKGGVRYNRNGFDLNRNWDTPDPVKMPENFAQRKAVLEWLDAGRKVDFFFTLHNTETSEYLDGAPEPSGRALLDKLMSELKAGSTFNPTRPSRVMEGSTTAGKPGRMNVCQGLWRDRKVPCFLMEQMISLNPRLGRRPTREDRHAFGKELVQAISRSVQ